MRVQRKCNARKSRDWSTNSRNVKSKLQENKLKAIFFFESNKQRLEMVNKLNWFLMEFSQGPLWFTTQAKPHDHQFPQSSKCLLPLSSLRLLLVSSQTHPQHCSCPPFTPLPLAPAILDNSVQAERHSRQGSEGTEKHLLSLVPACRESLSTGKQHTGSRYQSAPLSQPVTELLSYEDCEEEQFWHIQLTPILPKPQ